MCHGLRLIRNLSTDERTQAVVIASFFSLLLAYLADTPEQLNDTFRHVNLKKWMWPFGSVKYRPANGLVFLHVPSDLSHVAGAS